MLGSKKRQVLTDGSSAMAVTTHVEYAKVLGGMTVQRNDQYKLQLTVMVRPENDAPFEAKVSGYFPQYAQPSTGDQFWVRYDPSDHSKIEIDTARIAVANAAYETQAAEAAATSLPPDLAANGILGRATLKDAQQTPMGQLIDCLVTLNIRLIDGSPPFVASCHATLAPENAAKLVPAQTFLPVRVDPQNHARVAVSLAEEIPVVPIFDPTVIDPPARALREGDPCRVQILLFGRQFLATPDGSELYATKVRVTDDGSEFQIFLPVPAASVSLLQVGAELPARRLATEPNVLTVDWTAAAAEHGGAIS